MANLSLEPPALLEILGEPVIHRMVEVLRRADIAPIFLVIDQALAGHAAIRSLRRERIEILSGSPQNLPVLLERAVKRCADSGIDHVLLMEASTYAEIHVDAMTRAHRQSGHALTLAQDDQGVLPIALVNASEPDLASSLMQRRLLVPQRTGKFQHAGYVNRLRSAKDMRQLGQDALQRRCRIRPNGEEIRSGVWIARTAYIHPAARLVSPAYVGANSRLRSGVVISDSSLVERDCIVERGTVVNNSTVLAGTYVGVCLDVSNMVANKNRLVDLRRNVELEIGNSLMGASALSPRTMMPAFWASKTGNSVSRFGLREKFRNLLPRRPTAPVAAPGRIAYAPVESWGTLKSLSGTDTSRI